MKTINFNEIVDSYMQLIETLKKSKHLLDYRWHMLDDILSEHEYQFIKNTSIFYIFQYYLGNLDETRWRIEYILTQALAIPGEIDD